MFLDTHIDFAQDALSSRSVGYDRDTHNKPETAPQRPNTVRMRMLEAAASEFVVVTADTPELLREAYRLRHQVYCIERGFEANEGSDIETDAFDDHAPHIVVRRKCDGGVVGAARLVLSQPGAADHGLPLHRLCGAELTARVPMARTGEISRFSVSKERRGLSSDATALLRLALAQGMLKLSAEYGVTHWCAVMERSLIRLLRSTAIHFEAFGPMIEYHGMRQPVVGCIDSILKQMKVEQPEIWEFVTLGGTIWPPSPRPQLQ